MTGDGDLVEQRGKERRRGWRRNGLVDLIFVIVVAIRMMRVCGPPDVIDEGGKKVGARVADDKRGRISLILQDVREQFGRKCRRQKERHRKSH